jgi:ribonuclease HI
VEYLDETALNIYTDGSSYSHPRRGGVGIRFVTVDDSGEEQVFDYTPVGYSGATNQQMEIQACIEALVVATSKNSPVAAANYRKVVIYTDSMYVVDNFDRAKFDWSKTKWTTRSGTPVANAQLWKELIKMVQRVGKRVEIKWVKGHKRSTHNRAVDKLAKQSAGQPSGRRVSNVKVRRKKSPRSVEVGSVEMRGQRATIRVITDEYLRVQRRYKYKYEVMSKASPYYQNVDIVYSGLDVPLSAGHTYYVGFNDNTKNPRIEKLYREV